MQMIGSDFDGTIVQRKKISTKTREQIEAFRKRGNQFVIVSGRTVAKMKEGLKKYEADFYDEIIACNGAAILDRNLNWIEEQTMDEETVKKLLRDLAAYDPVADGGRAVSFALQDGQAMPTLPDNVQAFRNGPYVDIVKRGVSKAAALRKLAGRYEVERLFTIGDGLNDIPLLDCAKDSYSFAHCPDEVKAHARTIHTKIEDVLEDILHIQS